MPKQTIKLEEVLEPGVLIARYKRFLADVQLENGQTIVAHCPNPGSMLGCAEPGSKVLLRKSDSPTRRLPYTWVLTVSKGGYVNVDTLMANKIVYAGLSNRQIPEFAQYNEVIKEYTLGDSRFDFAMKEDKSLTSPSCIVEVKSTTLLEKGKAMFPDAKTERGRKHLRGLIAAKKSGLRAVQFFLISRSDASTFSPAEHIDPEYANGLRQAHQAGVEVIAWSIDIKAKGHSYAVGLNKNIPVVL